MDYEAIKRLGLAYMNIDYEKSYEIYDSIHNNHIINIYLNVDKNLCCHNCGSFDFLS